MSEQAEYWLTYFHRNPSTRINYSTLMAMGVSRRKSMAIIRELLRERAIERITYAGGGSRYTLSELTTVVSSEVTTVVTSGYTVKQYNHSASTAIVPIAVQLEMNNIATNKFLD
jgi:hypothetical protein